MWYILSRAQKCGKQYVCETYRPFYKRMKEHPRYIQKGKYDKATGRHFNFPDHTISDFSCCIIHIMGNELVRYDEKRITREEMLIDQLKTRKPNGLNDKYIEDSKFTTTL